MVSVGALFKDMYPRAGERIKQWVVDQRKQHEWEQATCPWVDIAEHDDNTGVWCHNSGRARWVDMAEHHCCHACGDMAEHTRMRLDIVAWKAERAARPLVCSDRSVLSDEIAADPTAREHPLLGGKR